MCRWHSARLFDSGSWRARLLDHSLEALCGEAGGKAANGEVEDMASAEVQDADCGCGSHDALSMLEKPESC